MNEKNIQKFKTRLEVEEMKPNISELARRNGLSTKTIKKHIQGIEVKKERVKRGSKLDPYKGIVIDKYDKFGANASDIYHFLKAKTEYDGCYDLVKVFLKEHKVEQLNKATIRVETTPGLQAQVDWKESLTMINKYGEVFKVNIFLYDLCFSRTKYIELTLDRTQPTLFEALFNAFDFCGGVPKEIWFDNMKTVVESHDINTGTVKFNDKFLMFAKDASFQPIACRPYRPQTKGKVESVAKLMNRLRPYNEEFSTLEELDEIVKTLNKDINDELCSATGFTPFELLKKEKEYLFPLVNENIKENYKSAKFYKVSKESMITYKGHKYSVPVKYISKSMSVKEIDNNVNIFFNGELIVQHPICNKKFNYRREDVVEILKSDVYKNKSIEEINKKAEEILKMYDEVK